MQTTLYFREGASDKVYHASIAPVGSGFAVNFAYGRRGATLATGTKTQSPVDRAEAQKIYDKLVKSKTDKGYAVGESVGTYTPPAMTADPSAILPQLLNPIAQSEITALLLDANIAAQEKLDGRRMLLRKKGDVVTAYNRKGQPCGFPDAIRKAAIALGSDFVMDGEAVGDVFHAFDLLEWQGSDLRPTPYRNRLHTLVCYVKDRGPLRYVAACTSPLAKRELLDRLKRRKAEGIVFKRLDAAHSAGRPASGGAQLKYKFVQTASCIVAKINTKRSAALQLLASGRPIAAGNVTIPPNFPVPTVGQVVEVRYLYAMPDSGSLYQPVYLGVRDDIDAEECQTTQLKYKKAA